MRILNIHSYPTGLLSPTGTPNGGGEKVHLDVHNLLTGAGIQCYSLCSPSDNLIGEKWIPILPSDGEEHWKSNWNFIKQEISKTIQTFANLYDDLVIINQGSDKLLRLTNSMGIPCLFIDHRSNQIHKLYHESFFTKDAQYNQSLGGKVVTVSPFSKKKKEETIEKYWGVDVFKYDSWLQFQFITDELNHYVEQGNGCSITIGRPEANKNPHIIAKAMNRYENPYEIYTTLHDSSKQDAKDYFKERLEPIIENVVLNANRDDTLSALRCASIYVSTTPMESAGITAFESISSGVPLLLNSKHEEHASTMFCSENSRGIEYEFFDPNSKQSHVKDFIDYCNSLDIKTRCQIAYDARERNDKTNIASKIIEVLKTITKTKKPEIDL